MTCVWDLGRIGKAFLVSSNKAGNGVQEGSSDLTHLAEEESLGKARKACWRQLGRL